MDYNVRITNRGSDPEGCLMQEYPDAGQRQLLLQDPTEWVLGSFSKSTAEALLRCFVDSGGAGCVEAAGRLNVGGPLLYDSVKRDAVVQELGDVEPVRLSMAVRGSTGGRAKKKPAGHKAAVRKAKVAREPRRKATSAKKTSRGAGGKARVTKKAKAGGAKAGKAGGRGKARDSRVSKSTAAARGGTGRVKARKTSSPRKKTAPSRKKR